MHLEIILTDYWSKCRRSERRKKPTAKREQTEEIAQLKNMKKKAKIGKK